MAKVTGPFLSLEAYGTLAGVLTAQRRPGRPSMYRRTSPGYRRAKGQHRRRVIWRFAARAWRLLTDGQVLAYNAQAAGRQQSGFNLFVSQYCRAEAWPDAVAWALVGL